METGLKPVILKPMHNLNSKGNGKMIGNAKTVTEIGIEYLEIVCCTSKSIFDSTVRLKPATTRSYLIFNVVQMPSHCLQPPHAGVQL